MKNLKIIAVFPFRLAWEIIRDGGMVLAFFPILLFAFLYLILTYIVDWVRTGNPFTNEYGQPREVGSRSGDGGFIEGVGQKRQRKPCPICRRLTYCRVQRGVSGMWIHTQRG